VSSKTAAEWLGVSQNTIRKLVGDGKLAAYLIGEKKLVRFDPADLDKYLRRSRDFARRRWPFGQLQFTRADGFLG
jgi:excisionase family DNA binding protein